MTVFFRKGILVVTAMVLLSACSSKGQPVLKEYFDSVKLQNVAIAPLDEALTFARVLLQKERHVIVVTKFSNGKVEGIDLTRAMSRHLDDPISAYTEIGYTEMVKLVKNSQAKYAITANADQLMMPVDLHDKHIAAGINYLAHAGETGVEEGPFLFSKHVKPTRSNANVAIQKGLLDYEVELAAVTLGPVRDGKLPQEYGLILTNDFTNRAALLRGIDVTDVTSGKGFATGKSFPGFLPVGNLFVIPKNPEKFAKNLSLQLFVNGSLRQDSSTDLMVWDFEKIASEAWDKKDVEWEFKGKSIKLMAEEPVIKARTLILSGTPDGVVFQGIPLTTKLAGIFSWVSGGWDTTIPLNVMEVYIQDAAESGLYLQPNDTVSIYVDTMGSLNNKIVP
jgi:2,4-diketo-3-deoxy-L-fuconate hydrolase